MNARVRLTIKDTPGALDAAEMFSSGETDLAVVRGDVGDLSQAQAVIVLAHSVVLLVAPPGSPTPIPADDLTTPRISFYVEAGKTLDNDLVADLTEDLMKARRDLLRELPILAQVTAASTDSDAYLSVHPGAAAFYNGTRQAFLDRWGNTIFLTPMILGGLASVLAAAWKFLGSDEPKGREAALDAFMRWAARSGPAARRRSCPKSRVRSTGFSRLNASARPRGMKTRVMSRLSMSRPIGSKT